MMVANGNIPAMGLNEKGSIKPHTRSPIQKGEKTSAVHFWPLWETNPTGIQNGRCHVYVGDHLV